MRQQTKPFVLEIKQSRKLKSTDQKPSIWEKLDLKPSQDMQSDGNPIELPAVAGDNDRP